MKVPNNILEHMSPNDRKSLGKAGRTAAECQAACDVKLERELHRLISNELLRRGIVAIHSRTDKRATVSIGIPDYCFVIDGKPYAMEVKMPGGKLTSEQESTRSKMCQNGWSYHVVYSFEEAQMVINKGW